MVLHLSPTYISTYWVTGVDISTSSEVLHFSTYINTYWITGVDISTSSEVLHFSTYISTYWITGVDNSTSSEVLHLSLHILVLTGLLVLISALPVWYYIYLYLY